MRGLRRDHRHLGRREVAGDGHLRGCRVLLRGQPAARDDPLAGRAVRPRGEQGRASGRGVRRARRRLLRHARPGARRPRLRRAALPDPLPRGRRPGADQPLQGDAPAPPARQRRLRGGGPRPRAHAARPAEGARRRLHRHERPLGGPAAQGRGRQDAPARPPRQARRDVHDVRLQARHAARRRPHLRRPLPAEPALRGRTCASRPGSTRTSSTTWRTPTASASSTRA